MATTTMAESGMGQADAGTGQKLSLPLHLGGALLGVFGAEYVLAVARGFESFLVGRAEGGPVECVFGLNFDGFFGVLDCEIVFFNFGIENGERQVGQDVLF